MKRLYDRSRVEKDLTCPRARFWNYEFCGRGLQKENMTFYLAFGVAVHDGLAALALGVDIDSIAVAARDEMLANLGNSPIAPEQACLVEGLLRGFAKTKWPDIVANYDIIDVEKELELDHDTITFMCKPDLLVRDESGIHYIEYKTTSSVKDKWFNSWKYAVQLQATAKAIAEHYGEWPESMVVQGLYKGYSSYGKQNSPLCYGYLREGEPPFYRPDWATKWKRGYTKSPIWERAGGVAQWIDDMDQEILLSLFPQAPPVWPDPKKIDAFFEQQWHREEDILTALEHHFGFDSPGILKYDGAMASIFRQNFGACEPAYGTECDFIELCHGNPEVGNEPPQGFTWRTPHHEPEAVQHRDRWPSEDEA